jgi:hypothetical protein
LPIFVGGDLINKSVDKLEKEEVLRHMNAPLEAGEATLLKGVVRGGLEKDFSPLKTRSARKLGVEKEKEVTCGTNLNVGPRALRAQKSLARVKK